MCVAATQESDTDFTRAAPVLVRLPHCDIHVHVASEPMGNTTIVIIIVIILAMGRSGGRGEPHIVRRVLTPHRANPTKHMLGSAPSCCPT